MLQGRAVDWESASAGGTGVASGTPVQAVPFVGRIAIRLDASGSASGTLAALQAVRFELAEPLNPGQSLEIASWPSGHRCWLEQDEGYHELPLPDLRLAGADEVEGTLLVDAPPEIELAASELLGRFAAGGRRRAAGRRSGCSTGTVLPFAAVFSTATRTPAASAGGSRSG